MCRSCCANPSASPYLGWAVVPESPERTDESPQQPLTSAVQGLSVLYVAVDDPPLLPSRPPIRRVSCRISCAENPGAPRHSKQSPQQRLGPVPARRIALIVDGNVLKTRAIFGFYATDFARMTRGQEPAFRPLGRLTGALENVLDGHFVVSRGTVEGITFSLLSGSDSIVQDDP